MFSAPVSERTLYAWLFAAFAFVLGTVVGSFLNVCIYRLPLGLSVNEPRRSFCPQCRASIAWHQNLPLLSWLWLRGKCASCRKPISIRYPLVELLTGALFLLVWLQIARDPEPPWLALPYWVFVSLLIVATFIDFDHLMIPDEITLGMAGAGVLFSFAFPGMMNAVARWQGGLWAIIGAAVGYAALWTVVELGKKAFGRKRIVLPEPQDFVWTRHGDDADLVIGQDTDRWSELFMRESDALLLECDRLVLAGAEHGPAQLRCYYNRVEIGGESHALDSLDQFSGRLREYVFPREAMGMGDVKLIAGIGAYLGWKAVFFSIAGASFIGSFVGLSLMAFGPKEKSLRIPFGPYLSVGALIYLFAGQTVIDWYLTLFSINV